MQLGGTAAQLYDQVRDGVADIVWTLPGYTAGRFPVMEVFELPFMMSNAEVASRAAWEFYEKHGRHEFREVRPLAVHVHDAGYLHTRERQVRTLADFKGLKLRAPTRQTNRLLAALGDTGVDAHALADAMSGASSTAWSCRGSQPAGEGAGGRAVPYGDRPEPAGMYTGCSCWR
jgi:TRAP-type C4-dicarboxylate transport system substrate-binding protein